MPKKNKKKNHYPYGQAEDGNLRAGVTCSLPITCCDCGLRHFIIIYEIQKDGTFKPNKKPLAFEFYRDYSMTDNNRRVKKWTKK